MNITKEACLTALSQVIDPDFKKDLVTLNMIENIEIEGNAISFTVVLTTPACPLKEHLESECRRVLKEAFGEAITIHIEMSSRVTTQRADLNFLPGVKNIIAVASGKGGVGKSTVSVNLALALAKKGAKVGLMDADIYGPSIPIMFGLEGKRPRVEEVEGAHKIIPIEKYGVKLVSIGFLVAGPQAVVWRGPMVSSAIRQFVTDVIWGELDYLLIDLPPGTGDIHLSIVSMAKPTGAIVVTTPQDVALADARKAIDMFRNPSINVPVLGVAENMSYFTPDDAPEKKYHIFGQGGGSEIAAEFDTNFLGQLPIHPAIRQGGDDGEPFLLSRGTHYADAFEEVADNVARQVAISNAPVETISV
ncbi:MAG: Mrp/NBP35 family ATP-binding protein [Saprospiraceae bacterium]|nr:Mrp/NBP35 family ATP-binding protein [Saprospiraceae bacterium]